MRSLAILFVVASSLTAQPIPSDPDLVRATVALGLPAESDRMAVDADGNVFINGSITGDVFRVSAAGVVDLNYFVGLGLVIDLARNPADGRVYALSSFGGLASELWRLDAVPFSLGTFTVAATSFTFDDQGTVFFAGASAAGPGLHQALPGGGTTFLDVGFLTNDRLLALRDGSLLTGSSAGLSTAVERFVPGVPGTQPFYALPFVPNQFNALQGIARAPFNEFGSGVIMGFNDFLTLGGGSAVAVFTDTAGGSATTLVYECCQPLPIPPAVGSLRAVATGWRQDLFWLSSPPGTNLTDLYRIATAPGLSVPGSLLSAVTAGPSPSFPQQIEIDLTGPPGAPFLLGAVAVPPPVNIELIAPPFGVIGLNPAHPAYLPILDGIGLFVPPQALAVIPGNGRYDLDVPVPLGVGIPSLRLEALLVSSLAPNELFFITNVAML